MTIKNAFLAQFAPSETDFAALPAYGCAAFNARLKQLMVAQGTTEAGQQDALRNVQSEIAGVREIMTENIERVLERGERIDLLVDKTDRLGGLAGDFRVRSRGLRRQMWWKNVRLMALLVVVVLFLVYLFIGFGCGLPGECLSQVSMCRGSGGMLLTVLQAGRGVFIIKPDICFWVKGECHFFFCGVNCKRRPGSIPFSENQNSLYIYMYQYSPTANQIARILKKDKPRNSLALFPRNYAKSQTKRTSPHA